MSERIILVLSNGQCKGPLAYFIFCGVYDYCGLQST
jgi:hypothetical protein